MLQYANILVTQMCLPVLPKRPKSVDLASKLFNPNVLSPKCLYTGFGSLLCQKRHLLMVDSQCRWR